MERLLVVKLDAQDCAAELWLNGVPLVRADADRPRVVMPVHEYTAAGENRLELVVWPHATTTLPGTEPPPLPLVADGRTVAQAHVLLPRVRSVADEANARSLAQLTWAPVQGTAYEAPHRLAQDVVLPVSFPRWRWLDAPLLPQTPEDAAPLQAAALALVQQLGADLAAGELDRVLATLRLRTEELAVAYLRQPSDETARLRERFAQWHGEGRLVFAPVTAVVLRPIAGGRLYECLGVDGGPALVTLPDAHGRVIALPLRVAAVEGKLYVLR